MKASSAHRLLPFKTFGEAATFDLEVEVSCRCGRRVVIDGMAPTFRDRRIMGTRFRCTTMLPHGVACAGLPSIYIRKRGRGRWTMADHSHAIRSRQAVAPIDAKPGTFASIVKRCEVAFLYDRGCVPSYTVDMIEFDEPPWNRFLDSHGAGSFAQAAARRSTCTLATDPVRQLQSVSWRPDDRLSRGRGSPRSTASRPAAADGAWSVPRRAGHQQPLDLQRTDIADIRRSGVPGRAQCGDPL
jgi:hypothetical protein